MRSIFGVALIVGSALGFSGAAYASGDSVLKPGDAVKEIEADRERQQQMQQDGAQSGRSATEPGSGGAPLDGKQKEENVLEGVDPAARPRQ